MSKTWSEQFEAEIQRAMAARAAGNEGLARVCARRAAGALIGEYQRRNALPAGPPGAYDRLKYLAQLPQVPEQVKAVAAHFLMRITPQKTLPVNADLIAEAHWLRQKLLDE